MGKKLQEVNRGTRSTETLDMKFFVVIALAGAAVASPSNRNDDDGAAAALECTAGTNIGDKLANAFSSCFGSMAGMRKERGSSWRATTSSATAMMRSCSGLRKNTLTTLVCFSPLDGWATTLSSMRIKSRLTS